MAMRKVMFGSLNFLGKSFTSTEVRRDIPMAGDLFMGVLQTLFFTVFAIFFIGIFSLVGLMPIFDIYFCGFLNANLFFFYKFIFESILGEIFAEID